MSSSSPDHSTTSASMLCVEDASEAISDHPSPPSLAAVWQPYDDDSDISELIDAEARHMASADYLRRCGDGSVDVSARLDAINWMLKVQAFYEFHPVTAFLSINYMDRFLSLVSLPVRSRWAFQLLSVACLSVAAKMEEPQVPLLLDLQLFQPTLLFHPKTLRRMELCLLSNLNWTLRSITPFHYLHYYLTNLPSSSSSFNRLQLLSAASDLILASTRVIKFLEFPPSAVAAAAVLCSAGHHQPHVFHHRVNHEMVRRCHQLMEDYVLDTCPASTTKATRGHPPPQSPVAVLDVSTCASCDTPSSAHPQHDPPNKRLRSSAPDVRQP
ncbi:cyclin-D4-1 isoform X1 [Arachis duranensis]|uniref:B-like cyclin n=1 Tax=Arachis duranensis TaxID=130453 RepID=A0A6P4C353_ARADU|nr:cyclin-D4-1 isoform X1 [Arachis duranensis]